MAGKQKKKNKPKPRKPKIDLQKGMPRPKPISSLHGPIEAIQNARQYPFLGCWVLEEWQESGITDVIVARQTESGKVLAGIFLVDLFCLGVKDAFWNIGNSEKALLNRLERKLPGSLERVDPSLAHEIIYGAVEFARKYGFEPHRGFDEASLVLDPPGTHMRKHHVTFGRDGKPFYISGPHDNPRLVISQLERTAGEGNFDYVLGFGP